MKRFCLILLTFSLMLTILPAYAAGADIRADLPKDIRTFFSSSTFNGYTIHKEAVEVFENTIGGSFAFAIATKGSQHTLYGFEWKSGKWQYWLKNSSLLLPQPEPYRLDNAKGSTDLETDYLFSDSLNIIYCPSDVDYYLHTQTFEVNEYGQWHLKCVYSDILDENEDTAAWVEKDRIVYRNNGTIKGITVWGVVETNLRYCSISAFPATVKAAREVLTTPPSIPGSSQLSPTLINFTGGQKYPVYSGPDTAYERAAGGKAAVSTNDWIQVFGKENGYILIQYDIAADQMRFGYIDEKALPKNADIAPLSFDDDEAVVTQNTFLTDDPLKGQGHIRSLSAGQQGVTWLATMGDWVYVEVSGSGKAVRGFVPAHAITRTPGKKTYTAAYSNWEYTANVTAEVINGTQLLAEIAVSGPASWYFDQDAAVITGYQLYANNVPVACQTASTQLSLSSHWHSTFSLSGTLPGRTALLGLCPIREGSPVAAETIMISLFP